MNLFPGPHIIEKICFVFWSFYTTESLSDVQNTNIGSTWPGQRRAILYCKWTQSNHVFFCFYFFREFFVSKVSFYTEHIWQIILYTASQKLTYINVHPYKPHFYVVKLGFTGVHIIFLISVRKHRLWVLVRTASPQSMFWAEIWEKYQNFIWKFSFFGGKIVILFK